MINMEYFKLVENSTDSSTLLLLYIASGDKGIINKVVNHVIEPKLIELNRKLERERSDLEKRQRIIQSDINELAGTNVLGTELFFIKDEIEYHKELSKKCKIITELYRLLTELNRLMSDLRNKMHIDNNKTSIYDIKKMVYAFSALFSFSNYYRENPTSFSSSHLAKQVFEIHKYACQKASDFRDEKKIKWIYPKGWIDFILEVQQFNAVMGAKIPTTLEMLDEEYQWVMEDILEE